jgi:predicted RNA-binding protein Jag
MLTDTKEKLESLVELLRASAGLDLTATMHGVNEADRPEASGIRVELTGSDASLLTENNGELLDALEHLAVEILRLGEQEGLQISFDAANFRVTRAGEVRQMANFAIGEVRTSSLPYTFAPMNLHDRRLLHKAFATSGLTSISTGEGSHRTVVLYPAAILSRSQVVQRPSQSEMV